MTPTSGPPGKHEDLTTKRNLNIMAFCRNCGWQEARPTVELCWPCYDYKRRTGQPRPAKVVLRHIARVIARDVDGRQNGTLNR